MRITLVNSSLSAGGAEKVMSIMANYWSENGKIITLITLASIENDFYSLNSGVKRVGLDLMGDSKNPWQAILINLKRIQQLRKAIKSSCPEVIISFVDKTNIITILASIGLKIPVIISERTNPREHNIGRFWGWMRSLVYPLASAIVVQSKEISDWAEEIVKKKKIYIIPNPVELPLHGPDKQKNVKNKHVILAMGRLSPEKGFDLLFSAFKQCAEKHQNWQLIIIGEGPERDTLKSNALDLGISERVNLPGLVKNTSSMLCNADLFVLSSRYEGFPNALLEAMACGVAVVSFDCHSGPSDIIRDGVDGLLVPPQNVDALAKAMDRLMNDEAKRKLLASRAPEVKKRFGLEKVMSLWEQLLNRSLGGQT